MDPFTSLQLLSSSIPCFNFVPVFDLVFTQLPAEIDLSPFADVREIDQAHVEIFQENPHLLQRIYATFQAGILDDVITPC